jgi:hypothetical protein
MWLLGQLLHVPAAIVNAPAQPALRHRIGTHASFFESMLAWLVVPPEQAVRCDGAPEYEDPDPLLDAETGSSSWPLRTLTSREIDDPTIALLDAWAMVGDVLTFYQERIANEGYLHTALEQRSVEELARLVGYRPRPGVAASVDLAFTLERDVITTIPAGARAQSLPAPGKLPQTFETSQPLVAKAVWNAMQPLQSRFLWPRVLDGKQVVYLAGTATNLRINDVVYLPVIEIEDEGEGEGDKKDPFELATEGLFRVDRIDIHADISKTCVHLRRYTNGLLTGSDDENPEFTGKQDEGVGDIVLSFADEVNEARYWSERELLELVGNDRVLRDSLRRAIEEAGASRRSKSEIYVFRASSPLFGHNAAAKRFLGATADAPIEADWPFANESDFVVFLDAVNERVQPGGYIVIDQATAIAAPAKGEDASDEITKLVEILEAVPAEQGESAGPFDIREATKNFFQDEIAPGPNPIERFWLDTLNSATADLPVFEPIEELVIKYALFQLLQKAKPNSIVELQRLAFGERVAELVSDPEFKPTFENKLKELDAAAGKAGKPQKIEQTLAVHEIESVRTYSRNAYGIAKQTLELVLESAWFHWPAPVANLDALRLVVTYHESEALRVARTPLEQLGGALKNEDNALIELEGLIFDLEPGRALIIEGEDFDAPGALRTEYLTISAIRHDLVDVSTHVTLTAPLQYAYRRARTIIYGNVARATQGESRREVLGSGDASKPSQRFTLRHQPLTHVPAATASGAASTLTVRVQGFAWPEVEHRALLGPRDRNITTQTDEQRRTIVTGGDGWQGARFPTGIENIVAEYRSGQGADGNVDPNKATSGGADPDDIESTRLRAPLAVSALDRLLSVDDYRSFALNFAGIAKAEVTRVVGPDVFESWRIRTIVAGIEPKPLDPNSELMLRLSQAMQKLGDPSLDLEIVPAKLQRLTIKAKLAITPGYAFVNVEPLVRAQLLAQLSYAKQGIGRGIPPSRIAALMQAVVGVDFVDLDELSIPKIESDEEKAESDEEKAEEKKEVDKDPLVFDPSDTIIVPAADTILFVDPTHPDTLMLEELTP